MKNKKIILSFNVCAIPYAEEVMTGAQAHYDTYLINVPIELFPKDLIEVIKGTYKDGKFNKKYINNISVCVPPIIEKPNTLYEYDVYYIHDNQSYVFKVAALNENDARNKASYALGAFEDLLIYDIVKV